MAKKLFSWLRIYVAATRPQFLPTILLPVMLGSAIAWHQTKIFDPYLFAIALLAAIFVASGVNVLNDYFDFKSGADNFNPEPLTPFAGGSRMIQQQQLSPQSIFNFGAGLLVAAALLGFYLVAQTGWPLLGIGLVGIALGVFYSSPPFAFSYRGLGEISIGIGFGWLSVTGAYFVQTGLLFSWPVFIAGSVTALLTAAVVLVNEFPDAFYDQKAGKNTLVVQLGLKDARRLFFVVLSSVFLIVLLSIQQNGLTGNHWWALLPIPLLLVIIKSFPPRDLNNDEMVAVVKPTIALHSSVMLLLTLGFVL
ncbi:MAG: 1,4-dihydroxy-2-naphthoate octaprenyltransferase [Pseudomonadales bacterium]|nr:1,4-dihydroxy-2-naphthoate octaprenyltransferase [Pseudomonadales bacterium]